MKYLYGLTVHTFLLHCRQRKHKTTGTIVGGGKKSHNLTYF